MTFCLIGANKARGAALNAIPDVLLPHHLTAALADDQTGERICVLCSVLYRRDISFDGLHGVPQLFFNNGLVLSRINKGSRSCGDA